MMKEDSPKAFKLWINKSLLERMAEAINSVYKDFDRKQFVRLASQLAPLELKDRVRRVRDELRDQLPQKYSTALGILIKSLEGGTLKSFDLWPYTEFIQTYGLNDLDISLAALKKITPLFTSEFAIRPFIRHYPQECLKYLLVCANDSDAHIRRWASEGTRPRLPWGEKLEIFIKNPSQTLAILETLKHDPELYVRKSVSNHLNDIAKDHPDLVIRTLSKWQAEENPTHSSKIEWITHRSLRNLIKAGHPQALKLIGANHHVKIKVSKLTLNKKYFRMNDILEFNFELLLTSNKPQKIVIDYVIHHVKANKETTPKVFKLKTQTLAPHQRISISKKHTLKPITTRKYYSGGHLLEIQINGKIFSQAKWSLKV